MAEQHLGDLVVAKEEQLRMKEAEEREHSIRGDFAPYPRRGSGLAASLGDETVPSKKKPPERRKRQSFLFESFSGLLNLEREAMNIGETDVRSQLQRLNRLMRLDTTKPRLRQAFHTQMFELVQTNPDLARCRFEIDGFDEYLLHQVVSKNPLVALVRYIHEMNPKAITKLGYGNFNVLHHACWSHNSAEVIGFLVSKNPKLCQGAPFPPLFCAIDRETKLDVLELLVRTYPEALCSSDISAVTPLDIALTERMLPDVIRLFLAFYPSPELKLSEKAKQVRMTPEQATILAGNHSRIRSLDGTFMNFTPEGLASFFHTLAANTNLEELVLNLSHAQVDPETCEGMTHFLQQNKALKKICIRGKLLSTAFAKCLVMGVATTNLSDMTVEVGLDVLNTEALLRNVADHETLRRLTVRNVPVEGTNFNTLSSLLLLHVLDVSNCQIGPTLAVPLADLLRSTKNLTELHVRNNQIGDDGAVLIAETLQVNTILEKLDFGQNGILERGWQAFVRTLREFNVSLRWIGFAIDDPLYDMYVQQVHYFCDQNGMGRTLPTIPNNPQECD